MVFLLIFIGVVVVIGIVIIFQMATAPKINAIVWKHPDNGGGMVLDYIKHKSPNQPFWIKLHWWQINEKPIFTWYEDAVLDKVTNKTVYITKPYEPKPDTGITPNGLYDNIDWECAHVFETVSSKWTETIKMGMSIVMVVVCVIGVIMLADMLNKNKKIGYIPEKTPAALVISGGFDYDNAI